MNRGTIFVPVQAVTQLACAVAVAMSGASILAADAPARAEQHFEKAIRPLLLRECAKCHGDRRNRGNLRLDSREAILKGGDSGPAVVPGKPDESLLMEAVRHESFEMPPEKTLSRAEIESLEIWIRDGAVWPQRTVPRSGSNPHGAAAFSAEDRSYWAFQPVDRPELPSVRNSDWCRNPIDRFILARLEAEGMEPAPEAEPRVLLRRLSYDLTGLPPAGEQVNALESGKSLDYESLVSELLDSPRYGEQWGRHWLDLVRYAESDGFRQDAYRPTAYRYRDYVIGALNRDIPYRQFILEQLAGDELGAETADAVVATGFLRLYLYEYNQRDARTHWQDILNELTDVTSDVFLGVGMGCARCHDHKFDPILQKDYFRLQSFLAGVLPRDDVPAASRTERLAYAAKLQKWKDATAAIRAEIDAIRDPQLTKGATAAITKFPPDIQEIMAKPVEGRDPLEKQLADLVDRQIEFEYSRVKFGDGDQKKLDALEAKLKEFAHLRPDPLPTAITVTDVSREAPVIQVPDTGDQVEPGFLTIIDAGPARIRPLDQSSGRRRALAEWMGRDDNPLTTRVIVNRVWQFHFGRGLVGNPSDLGKLGEPPTHPKLLDWLTSEFVSSGWSIKHLHQLIVQSATFRQSAEHPRAEEFALLDPSNRLRWRTDVRRLTAEQIRDSVLSATGELDLKMGGPSATANSSSRRSIYTRVVRNSPDPLLNAFDAADGFNSTAVRSNTTTATQALLLVNGPWMNARADSIASQLNKLPDTESKVRSAFLRIYSRQPDADELAASIRFLEQQSKLASTEKPVVDLPPFKTLETTFGSAVTLKGEKRTIQPTAASYRGKQWKQFSVEAVFQLDSLYPDATVRTIASQWDNRKESPGWAFGVTSTKSGYQPRNLILQLIGDQGYEVIASDLRPELGRPYFAAVAVDVADGSELGVTFYLKDLSKDRSPLQIARVSHTVTSGVHPQLPLIVGGRASQSRHLWEGQISEVRISNTRLQENRTLLQRGQPKATEIAHWRFDAASKAGDDVFEKNPLEFVDVSGNTKSRDPVETALADFCHALLNSSESLYVE